MHACGSYKTLALTQIFVATLRPCSKITCSSVTYMHMYYGFYDLLAAAMLQCTHIINNSFANAHTHYYYMFCSFF